MPDLGWGPPGDYNVLLARDNDFVVVGHTSDGQPLADGAEIDIVIGDGIATWPATINGADISWNVDKIVVNALIDQLASSRPAVRAAYSDASGLDAILFTGRVKVDA